MVVRKEFRAASRLAQGPPFEPVQNTQPDQAFDEILLCHARLYVFADRFDNPELLDITLYKLRRTLAAFKLFDERVPDLFALIRYSYLNTREGDRLRALLIEFAVCMVPELIDHAGWHSFTIEEASFRDELLNKLREVVGVARECVW
ncbi:uncharacterized protein A1O9_08335 [Exophiala aquamarina CBS 119918]|uniref:Uncharacterized protein n=1 Tax=Exophiala aquamarina CBS 119918 TaxID=1182545 RepID=A0A072PJ70_9EURO|nr:uncharacterized protein A1O9_08335 [Exophiala aquamarina CBS 119918]KEF55585.1 hypothetical protein A1O9_08335 [Exophiala aquamarina CBS 119918]